MPLASSLWTNSPVFSSRPSSRASCQTRVFRRSSSSNMTRISSRPRFGNRRTRNSSTNSTVLFASERPRQLLEQLPEERVGFHARRIPAVRQSSREFHQHDRTTAYRYGFFLVPRPLQLLLELREGGPAGEWQDQYADFLP